MEFDWVCAKPAFLDFETQSSTPLTTVHKYAKSPHTRALTCVVKVDGVNHRFGPYLKGEDLERLARITEGRTIVAHNAPFDEAIWTHVCELPPRKWYDTLPCARAAGFPGKLDQIAKIVTGEGKDKNGSMLIDLLCIVRGPVPPPSNPAYKLLLNYNEKDVDLLEKIFYRVHGFGNPKLMSVDRKMNERGIPVNRAHLYALLELYEKNKKLNEIMFAEATGGINPNSPKQVTEWMIQQGFMPPGGSVGKHAIRELARNRDKYFVGDGDLDAAYEALSNALDMRREVVRVGKGKVEAAIECLEDDDRIRDMLVIYGAGPGRWAGRGPQFHNMPVCVIDEKDLALSDLPLDYDSVIEGTKRASEASIAKQGTKIMVADVLGALLRHMVQAPNMLIADYSAIELRGTAYVADELRALNIFADPTQSIYLDMGERLFNRKITKKGDPLEYTLAKTLVLGCTYGMSGAKFGHICQTRTTSGRAYDKLKIDPREAVKAFRETYPRIPCVWREYHEAVHICVGRGEETQAGKSRFYMDGPDLHMMLPSGRPIVYRNARIEPRVPGYCKIYGMPEEPVDTVVYDSSRFHEAIIFGSKVCENAVQGMCADFIGEACIRSDEEGLHPIFTVHDELITEDDESKFPKFMEIMSTPPEWAHDFPMLAEGYSGHTWTKQTKRFKELVYNRGVPVHAT